MNRNDAIAQNYLALRQLTWAGSNKPRFTAIGAYRQAADEVTRDPPKRRYPHGMSGSNYGGNWESADATEPVPPAAFMPPGSRCPKSRTSREYYCDDWPAGWRLVGRADEVAKANDRWRTIEHSGWYTEDDGDNGTLAGYVLRLPHGKLIPGTRHSDQDGVTLYPNDIYSDEMECAVAADQYAERAAEQERDYQRAWQAGNDAYEKNEASARVRKTILQVCGDLRSGRASLNTLDTEHDKSAIERLCGIARDKVTDLLDSLYELRRDRDQLRDDYGTEDAFKEGFGS